MKIGINLNKKYLTTGIVFFVLFAGLSFFYLKSHQIPSHQIPVGTETVLITDNGFNPDYLVVSKGAKVVFKNIGQQPHWPASNFHPTHTLYPEKGGCVSSKFDACRGLEPGETFGFVLNVVGEWPLHDHLFPGLVMVIKVVGNKDNPSKKNTDQELPSASELRQLNYTAQLSAVRTVVEDDPVEAWNYIKKAYIINGQVVGNAHEFAHIIGNAIYSKLGLEGITKCDNTFAFGCYHGVSEQLLQEKGAGIVKEVQNKCLKILSPDKTQDYTGCIHGMGHGLLTYESMNIARALKDCDRLDDRYKGYCYDGVFMENSLEAKQIFNPNEPWKFCSDLPEDYHLNCARYQSQYFFDEFNKEIGLVTDRCDKAPKTIMKTTCFESVGYHVAQTAMGDFDEIKEECAKASTSDGRSNCIIGAAREVIFQKYQNWEKVSDELCRTLADNWVQKCLKF